VFAEDAAGTIWIGATDGALFRADGERFVRVPLGWTRPVGDIYAIHFARTAGSGWAPAAPAF